MNVYQDFFSLTSTIIKTAQRNLQGKKFEPEVAALATLIKPGDVCLDVGGAYGRYAFPLSKMVKDTGKIYSFEPGTYSYRVFWWNKSLFNLKNVTLTKSAVSNKSGEIQLCLPYKESGKLGASLAYIRTEKEADARCETVGMITLDDFSREHNLDRVDLIKCDTEGSELFVFQGAKAIMEKYQPIVLAEIDEGNLSRYQLKPADVVNFFAPWKYRLMIWQDGKFILKNSVDTAGNYFFMPNHMKIWDS